MDKSAWLNEFVGKYEEYTVITPFQTSDEFYYGTIQLNAVPKEAILIEVEIPLSYPFIENGRKCCRFVPQKSIDCKHINEDGTICLVIPICTDFQERFILELEALKTWRDDYYLSEKIDARYEYPIIPNQNQMTFLFTDIDKKLELGENGVVRGCCIAHYPEGYAKPIANCQITQIGDDKCLWNTENKYANEVELGLFYFIDTEPIEKNNTIFISAKSLEKYLPNDFVEKLYQKSRNSLHYFLFLGYNIINSDETHWLAIHLNKTNNIINAKPVPFLNNRFDCQFNDEKIEWCKTQNMSYERFFGRGSISKHLKDKKILILGIGAIGSSLAKILTRTGVMNIGFNDFDVVEAGNICRGEFSLFEIGLPKYDAISRELYSISPFVSVNFIALKNSKRLDEPYKQSTLAILNQFDIIFNCTADDELIYILDNLKPNADIINLSITDKAKALMCFVGNNIGEQLERFNPSQNTETYKYYEGTGCWNWTFEASYFDINAMLHLAVKNINRRFENGQDLRSFIVKYKLEGRCENLVINGI